MQVKEENEDLVVAVAVQHLRLLLARWRQPLLRQRFQKQLQAAALSVAAEERGEGGSEAEEPGAGGEGVGSEGVAGAGVAGGGLSLDGYSEVRLGDARQSGGEGQLGLAGGGGGQVNNGGQDGVYDSYRGVGVAPAPGALQSVMAGDAASPNKVSCASLLHVTFDICMYVCMYIYIYTYTYTYIYGTRCCLPLCLWRLPV